MNTEEEEQSDGCNDKIESTKLVLETYEDEAVASIPSEIWVKILTQLNQKELVRSRGVSRKLRNVIDEHFHFSIIIHDDKTDLQRIRHMKIKDCLITKLLGDADVLGYPEFLRRVRFWGPLNVLTLQRILLQTPKLEELSMTRFALSEPNLLPEETMFSLEKLLKLELLGYCCKDASIDVETNTLRLFSIPMPELKKIFVNISCFWKQMDNIIAAFLDLLARNRNKITHINASLVPASTLGTEIVSIIPTNIPIHVKEAIYSQDLQLESLRLTLATKYIEIWTPLINQQRKLTDFRVHWTAGSEASYPPLTTGIECSLLYPAIIQSAPTLLFVDLREVNLTLNGNRVAIPFDGTVFRHAQNLKRLILVRNIDDCQRHAEPYGHATITNIGHSLPSLEDLEIVRFKCKSSELQILIDNSLLLKTVKLQHTGANNGTGVHGGIIHSIVYKTGIKTLNICPINYYEPEENLKLDAVKAIYDGICAGGDRDHLYFDFERFRQGIPQPYSRYCPPIGAPVAPAFDPVVNSMRSRRPNRYLMMRTRAMYSRGWQGPSSSRQNPINGSKKSRVRSTSEGSDENRRMLSRHMNHQQAGPRSSPASPRSRSASEGRDENV